MRMMGLDSESGFDAPVFIMLIISLNNNNEKSIKSVSREGPWTISILFPEPQHAPRILSGPPGSRRSRLLRGLPCIHPPPLQPPHEACWTKSYRFVLQ